MFTGIFFEEGYLRGKIFEAEAQEYQVVFEKLKYVNEHVIPQLRLLLATNREYVATAILKLQQRVLKLEERLSQDPTPEATPKQTKSLTSVRDSQSHPPTQTVESVEPVKSDSPAKPDAAGVNKQGGKKRGGQKVKRERALRALLQAL